MMRDRTNQKIVREEKSLNRRRKVIETLNLYILVPICAVKYSIIVNEGKVDKGSKYIKKEINRGRKKKLYICNTSVKIIS